MISTIVLLWFFLYIHRFGEATQLGALHSVLSAVCVDMPVPPLPHLHDSSPKFFEL